MTQGTTLYGLLTLRPTRIGFLVRPTDLLAIRRIMRLCACLWGGSFNPIIPVCRTLPKRWRESPHWAPTGPQLTSGYLRFFEPDVYVEASPGLAAGAGLAELPLQIGQPRIVSLDQFVRTEEPQSPEFAFGLDIFYAYRHLYQKQFQFSPRQDRDDPIAELLPQGEGPGAGAFAEASFGVLPQDESLSYLRDAFREVFNPVRLKLTASAWLDLMEIQGPALLGLTRYRINARYSWSPGPILFILDPSSPLDLIDLWNLRLFRRDVIPVNINWISESRDFLRTFVEKHHRPLPRNPHGVMIHTEVQFGRSVPEDRVKSIREEIFAGLEQGSWYWSHHYDSIWDDHRDDGVAWPRRAQLSADTTDLDLTAGKDGTNRLHFRALAPEFAEPYGNSPVGWVNVLSLRDFVNQSQLATILPTTLQDPHRSRMRLGEPLLVSREGLILPQRQKNNREFLELPLGRDAIIDWLARRGIEARVSDPGRVADQVLSAVDGFLGAGLLAHKETLELLDKMAKSLRERAGRVEEFSDRTSPADRWVRLLSRRANEQQLGRRASLDDFVRAGALRLGLRVECPNCMKQNWYGLRDLDTRVTCGRCLSDFSFPQGSLNFGHAPWHYRVTGPFSVPDFAGGAYATVLALRAFAIGLTPGDASMVFSMNLDLQIGGEPAEVDFSLWHRREKDLRQWEEPCFVAGEAKSFADEAIKEQDVERLRRLAAALPGTFLVVAVLKDRLSEIEKARVTKLAEWGRESTHGRQRAPVIVLTGTELFSEYRIADEWTRKGDLRAELIKPAMVRLDNLETLADLTQQVYLGMPSYHEYLRETFRRRRAKNKRSG